MNIVAIIPAKAKSNRLPGKNLLKIDSETLVHRALRTAVEAGIFSRIILHTDSAEAMREAEHFSEVLHFWRDWQLSMDRVESAAIAFDCLSRLQFKCDGFCLLNPTSPCRTVEMLQRAYNEFRSRDLDCLVSGDALLQRHDGDFLFWKTIPFLRYISRSIIPENAYWGENSSGIDIDEKEDFDFALRTLRHSKTV